ncbi:hypothetical protein VA596_09645 [Amycolatopsis sp., V23-08]|uniref:Uncharacterized protein n=1 Tax=Amycolatopsis heterodermiae TaxID=3110235 RepID=A0ABU5R259_9PSEU|nr:hypothetical protein [Amycolatopsis sp., V23-08]MEA5359800.1 hypothetical protein [Amycolatopsis sp., V23-08]
MPTKNPIPGATDHQGTGAFSVDRRGFFRLATTGTGRPMSCGVSWFSPNRTESVRPELVTTSAVHNQ